MDKQKIPDRELLEYAKINPGEALLEYLKVTPQELESRQNQKRTLGVVSTTTPNENSLKNVRNRKNKTKRLIGSRSDSKKIQSRQPKKQKREIQTDDSIVRTDWMEVVKEEKVGFKFARKLALYMVLGLVAYGSYNLSYNLARFPSAAEEQRNYERDYKSARDAEMNARANGYNTQIEYPIKFPEEYSYNDLGSVVEQIKNMESKNPITIMNHLIATIKENKEKEKLRGEYVESYKGENGLLGESNILEENER